MPVSHDSAPPSRLGHPTRRLPLGTRNHLLEGEPHGDWLRIPPDRIRGDPTAVGEFGRAVEDLGFDHTLRTRPPTRNDSVVTTALSLHCRISGLQATCLSPPATYPTHQLREAPLPTGLASKRRRSVSAHNPQPPLPGAHPERGPTAMSARTSRSPGHLRSTSDSQCPLTWSPGRQIQSNRDSRSLAPQSIHRGTWSGRIPGDLRPLTKPDAERLAHRFASLQRRLPPGT
jgi:hypothetical protein